MTELVGEAVVELRGDDKRLKRDIKDAGTAGGRSFGDAFDKESRKGFAKSFRESVLSAGARAATVLNLAGVIGPAVLAIGSAASAATAGLTAVVGTIGPAAVAGAVAYAGALGAVESSIAVASFAFNGLSQAMAGNKKALAGLTPQARALIPALKAAKAGLETVRASVQKGLFPGVAVAVQSLGRTYFPLLRTQGEALGRTLGGLAKQGAAMATSGPFRRDFGTLAQTNTRNVGLFGRAGLQLVDALRSILVAAAPLTTVFARFALRAATAVNAMVQAGRASGGLQSFFTRAGATAAILGRILGNVAVALFNVFKIGAQSSGTSLLGTLEKISAQFRSWTGSASGIAALQKWFAEGRTNLVAMGKLVGAVSVGLSHLGAGKQLAPLLNQIRTQLLPPLLTLLQNASDSGALQALIGALSSLTGVFAQLSAQNQSLLAFSTTLKIIGDVLGFLVQHVPGASAALSALFVALGAGAALKLVGLGPLLEAAGKGMGVLATKALIAAGAADAETGALTANSVARSIANSTLATFIGVKAIEAGEWVRATAAKVADTVVTKGAAAAQFLLNAAMDANPIGLIVLAIAALVAGFILAYKHSATFRGIVQGLLGVLETAGKFIGGLLVQAFQTLRTSLAPLGTMLRVVGQIVRAVLVVYFQILIGVWRAVITLVIRLAVFLGVHLLPPLRRLGSFLLGILVGAFRNVRDRIASTIAVMHPLFSAIGTAIGWVRRFGSYLKGLASDGIGIVVRAIQALPGKISALGGRMKSAGGHIIGQFVDGLKHAAGVIGGIASNVWGALKRLLNGAIDKINNALEFTISLPGPDIHVNPPNIGHLAAGTTSWRGGWAEVGEHGRELVHLPQGARVVGNGDVRSGNRLGGLGQPPTFNIHLPTGDPEAAAQAVWTRWVLAGVGG